MAKGGARAHSGPPPDPNALRRERDGGDWKTLSAAGRAGDPPSWPLTRATRREMQIWKREWARPQALEWERNGQELEVALYVRSVRMAEMPKAPTNARVLVKQQQEALGLSLPGLLRNKWRIEVVSDERVEATVSQIGVSARDRFKVVDGGQP
jgi:hypothetical protein